MIIENWYFFAILNLLELNLDSSHDVVTEISIRLGLSKKQISVFIERLIKWGFVKKVQDNYIVMTNSWITTDNIPSSTIRKGHLQGFLLAQKALEHLPVEIRDMTSLVFPGNSKKINKAKAEIRKFAMKLHKIMNTGKLDSVYRLNTQLFPIDKLAVNKK